MKTKSVNSKKFEKFTQNGRKKLILGCTIKNFIIHLRVV